MPKIFLPREVLVFEIDRRCANETCGQRQRIGLTKREAFDYHGFACERCDAWTEDFLSKRDVPEWWQDLQAASFGELHIS